MARCWVNVKYYEMRRLSFVIFTYLLVCEESSQQLFEHLIQRSSLIKKSRKDQTH